MTELEDLQSQIDTLESMLTHASNTIARLEGRWRAPGAAKRGQRSIVVIRNSMVVVTAVCVGDGKQWNIGAGHDVIILAWCELPPIPSDEMYAGLE